MNYQLIYRQVYVLTRKKDNTQIFCLYFQTPGIPTALDISPDAIQIVWTKLDEKVDYYQIRYKSNECKENWKYADTETDCNQVTITRLKPNTRYTFQVRAIIQDQEGNYGQANDDLKTLESSASSLLMFSEKLADGNPEKYRLKAQEQMKSRNDAARTKKIFFGKILRQFNEKHCRLFYSDLRFVIFFSLGDPVNDLQEEKTILLIGATGSGKTTLVDGIVNYVMGVNFLDPFRFTIVQLEKEEQKTLKVRKSFF